MLHCSPPAEQITSPSTASPSTVDSSTTTPPPSDTARPVAGLRSLTDALVAAPPRGAPAELPDDIRGDAQQLELLLDRLYGGVKAAWEPRRDLCDPAEPSCKDAWRTLGQEMSKMREEVREMRGGMCGASAGELGTLARRRNDHRAFLQALLDEIDDRYARVAASMSARGEQEWLKIAANAKVTPPMPCLKCAPPPRQPRGSDVTFDDASSTLGKASDDALARLLTDVGNNRDEPIELVGHADPTEKGDLVALSQKRAEAIASWLGAKGVSKKRIRVRALGAMLPVSKDPSQNRRVESAFLRTR